MPDGCFSRVPGAADLHGGKDAFSAEIQSVAQTQREAAFFVELTNRLEVGGIKRR